MGCWDIYCILCGNPCHESYETVDNFLEEVAEYESGKLPTKYKKSFQPIYNKYIKNPKLFLNKIKLLKKNTKWLNKCTLLCADGKIIPGCKEIAGNTVFKDKYNNIYDSDFVFVHTLCWKNITKYKKLINYSVIEKYWVPDYTYLTKHKKLINYGTIEKYWGQYFNFILLILDNNEKLSEAPNLTVINKVVKLLVHSQ